jgi:hypothetical protein
LRHVVRNINHNDTGKTRHTNKITENVPSVPVCRLPRLPFAVPVCMSPFAQRLGSQAIQVSYDLVRGAKGQIKTNGLKFRLPRSPLLSIQIGGTAADYLERTKALSSRSTLSPYSNL